MPKHRLLAFVLIVVCSLATLYAQTTIIHGNVSDENLREPLIGVSILEQGTQNGTVTDFDGNFVLEVQEGATLLVSYIGYKDLALSAQPNMEILLLQVAHAHHAHRTRQVCLALCGIAGYNEFLQLLRVFRHQNFHIGLGRQG